MSASIQVLRAVHLINNLIAGAVCFAATEDSWNATPFFVLGGFLHGAWLYTIGLLIYVWRVTKRRSAKQGYCLAHSNEQDAENEGQMKPTSELPAGLALFMLGMDVLGVLMFLPLSIVNIVIASGMTGTWWGDQVAIKSVVGAMGGLVAAIVHIFFILVGLRHVLVNTYKIRIIVERHPRGRGLSFSTAAAVKEANSSPQAASIASSTSGGVGPSRGFKLIRGAHQGRDQAAIEAFKDDREEEGTASVSEASTAIRLNDPEESDRLILDHD